MTKKSRSIISIALAFLGAVVTLLGTVIPITLYFNSISERIVVFEVVSKTNLVGLLGGVDELEISIKEKPVKKAYLYLIKLKNTGTEPITVSDYEKPIQIKFDSEILSAKTKEKIPTNLSLDYLVEDGSVLVKPFLFNSEEEFSLEIVSSSKNHPSVESRIAGISEIKESYPSENSTPKLVITLTLSFILLVFYAKSLSFILLVFFSKYLGQFFERIERTRLISLRSLRSLTSLRSLRSLRSEMISAFTLSITCAFSSIALAETVIDIEAYEWDVSSLIVIPVVLGMSWALVELKSRYKQVNSTEE